jgi:hypothetical protein
VSTNGGGRRGRPAAMAGGAVNTRSIHSASERNASHSIWMVKQTTIAMYINSLEKIPFLETATRAWTKYIINNGARIKTIGAKGIVISMNLPKLPDKYLKSLRSIMWDKTTNKTASEADAAVGEKVLDSKLIFLVKT